MKRLLLLCTVLLLAMPAEAARLMLSADRSEVYVGEGIGVAITVINGQPAGVPSVQVSKGLDARYEHQTSQTFIRNFQQTTALRYMYRVLALEPGDYTIGPVVVEVDGQRLTTNSVPLRVRERPTDAAAPLQLTADFLPSEAWEGQVVLYRAQLHARIQVLQSDWKLPAFTGLIPPRDGEAIRRQFDVESEEGRVRVEERLLPFVVASTGTLDQRATVVQAHVAVQGNRPRRDPRDPFGRMARTRSETRASPSASLTVRPLPPPPPGFSGLVGEFSFDDVISRPTAKVGESLTWTIRVEGNGTLEGFSLPAPGDIDGARIYDEAPAVGARTTPDGYVAGGTLPRVVVPTRVGTLELPDVTITTFSVREGRYVTHTVEGPTLEVSPGEGGEVEMQSFEGDGPSLPEPELAVVDDGPRSAWRSVSATQWDLSGWLGVLLALTALPGGVMWFLLGWLEAVDRYGVTDEEEGITARAMLQDLPTDAKGQLAVLEQALRQAVVGAAELPSELGDELAAVTRDLQRSRYADHAPPDDLVARVVALVERLEVP